LYDEQRKKAFGKNLIKIGYFELHKPNIETDNQRYWQDYFLTGTAPDGAPDYIKKASKILQYVNLNEEEREVVDIMEKARATWEGELFTAYHDGREKGREEGRAEGRAEGEANGWQKGRVEGEASGWQKGRVEGVYETARNALSKGLSVAMVSEITGLDEKTVRDLAETLK
jgi:flagellar biosynthesis/type III secretory pathway protein FliH